MATVAVANGWAYAYVGHPSEWRGIAAYTHPHGICSTVWYYYRRIDIADVGRWETYFAPNLETVLHHSFEREWVSEALCGIIYFSGGDEAADN